MSLEQQLGRAWYLLQDGHVEKAEALCRQACRQAPDNGDALHLLGLILKAAGDLEQAERYLEASVKRVPGNAEYHANLGNLLRSLGRPGDAEPCYRRSLDINPAGKPAWTGFVRSLIEQRRPVDADAAAREMVRLHPLDPGAWTLLAMTARDLQKFDVAESCYRKALAVGPRYALAHHNLGSLLSLRERAEEALQSLQRAAELGVRGYELDFNLGRTYLQLYRFDAAERAFESAVQARPADSDAQLNLARVRFMRGESDFARDIAKAARAQSGDWSLGRLYGTLLQRAGDTQRAESHFRDLLNEHGPVPALQSALAAVMHETGQLDDAIRLAAEAARSQPDDPVIADNAVAIFLSAGDPERALPLIMAQRERLPDEQSWLAYEATAARLLGRDRYAELYDYDRLIRSYELEAPDGWRSIDELNQALLVALDRRHRFVTHPLDQSLRHGSQTARSMLTDPDPAIAALIEAFKGPVEDYRRALGNNPHHPVSARNTGGARITGAWSVKLHRDGFHVNHVHPEGWISSAYYVSVPAEVADAERKSGWLKFGEPRYPVPGAGPVRFVLPRAGRLVLFPSYMWHGTNPIHGDEARMTVAFDAVPDPG